MCFAQQARTPTGESSNLEASNTGDKNSSILIGIVHHPCSSQVTNFSNYRLPVNNQKANYFVLQNVQINVDKLKLARASKRREEKRGKNVAFKVESTSRK